MALKRRRLFWKAENFTNLKLSKKNSFFNFKVNLGENRDYN